MRWRRRWIENLLPLVEPLVVLTALTPSSDLAHMRHGASWHIHEGCWITTVWLSATLMLLAQQMLRLCKLVTHEAEDVIIFDGVPASFGLTHPGNPHNSIDARNLCSNLPNPSVPNFHHLIKQNNGSRRRRRWSTTKANPRRARRRRKQRCSGGSRRRRRWSTAKAIPSRFFQRVRKRWQLWQR